MAKAAAHFDLAVDQVQRRECESAKLKWNEDGLAFSSQSSSKEADQVSLTKAKGAAKSGQWHLRVNSCPILRQIHIEQLHEFDWHSVDAPGWSFRARIFMWHSHMFCEILLWSYHRSLMSPEKLDLLQGTLDLMVLQTLLVMASSK
jgi:hypothetical protein